MPLSCNCMKMNEIQFYNWSPKRVAGQSNTVWSPKMDCLKFWISKNVQFWHMCGAFRFWRNFGWPKIWRNPCWSPQCIALACYPWLILVINCDNEVCSHSNNTVSKAFWQNKVLPKQRISCCGVIYNITIVVPILSNLYNLALFIHSFLISLMQLVVILTF